AGDGVGGGAGCDDRSADTGWEGRDDDPAGHAEWADVPAARPGDAPARRRAWGPAGAREGCGAGEAHAQREAAVRRAGQGAEGEPPGPFRMQMTVDTVSPVFTVYCFRG